MGESDDDLTRRALLKIIEAVRYESTNDVAHELLDEAESIAKRIDAPRGKAKDAQSLGGELG